MKYSLKTSVSLVLVAVAGYLCMFKSTGSPAGAGGRTGAPFDNGTCGGCHNVAGTFTNPNVKIEVLDGATPVSVYTSGKTYKVRITITAGNTTSNTEYGFQTVCVQSSTTNDINNWSSLPSGTAATTINSRTYIGHNTPLTNNSIEISWIAPNVTMGNVSFYAAGLIADGNNSKTNDNVATASYTISPASSGCITPGISANIHDVDCYDGNNGSVNITTTGGTGPFAFDWSAPNYSASTQNVSGLKAGLYTLVITAKGGCKDTVKVPVNEPLTPLTLKASSNGPVCVGSSLDLYANGNGGNFGHTYNWDGPAGISANLPVFSIPNVTYDMRGDYVITVKDAKNCEIKDTIHVDVDSMPGFETITFSPLAWNIFQFNITKPKFVRKWSWVWGDGMTDSTPTPAHSFTKKGVYNTKVTVSNSCGSYSDSAFIHVWPINIGVIAEEDPSVKIYPNPASRYLTVEPSRGQVVNEVSLWTVTGTKVYQHQLNDKRNIRIDVSELPDGIYGIYIVTDKGNTFNPVNITH